MLLIIDCSLCSRTGKLLVSIATEPRAGCTRREGLIHVMKDACKYEVCDNNTAYAGRMRVLSIHIQGVHRNLRPNPVDPSSPMQKLTHTITVIVPFILKSAEFWFCPPHARFTVSVPRTSLNVLVLPVDPGISRGVTDLYPSRGYTRRKTRDRSITRSSRSLSDQKIILGRYHS